MHNFSSGRVIWAPREGASATSRRALLGCALVIGCFWTFAILAQRSGDDLALAWESQLSERPAAVVYSTDDLHLAGPGVTSTRLDPDRGGFAYRYAGLRLLIYSNDRWFLVADGWQPSDRALSIVLRDTEHIRVETMPATS